jgi:uncharacterized membrane protein YfcA
MTGLARTVLLLGAGAVAGVVGILAGGATGPALTRRVPGHVLRILAALAGLGLAIRLWAGG